MNVLITGNSSGLGLGFTEALLAQGATVWGLSRRGCPLQDDGLRDTRQDLADLNAVPDALERLLSDCLRLDLVILNAGVLGRIAPMHEIPAPDLEHIMRVNVWSNKVILDWLIERQLPAEQIVAVSSGAAANMHYGWNGYSLSKAALNNLIELYAQEMPDTHLTALAPGLVDTAMQDYLCGEVDEDDYPSVQKLKDARGTEDMPTPRAAAERILDVVPGLKAHGSGCFVDIRQL